MSKESEAILKAWRKGQSDRIHEKPYNNPYKKTQKEKRKAYQRGYNQ